STKDPGTNSPATYTSWVQVTDFESFSEGVDLSWWAWAVMLVGVGLFVAARVLKDPAAARVCYGLAFLVYVAALRFQVSSSAQRTLVAGMPPVAYPAETLIWLAFFVSIFAIIMEVVDRNKTAGLAGTAVAVLGMALGAFALPQEEQRPLDGDERVITMNKPLDHQD